MVLPEPERPVNQTVKPLSRDVTELAVGEIRAQEFQLGHEIGIDLVLLFRVQVFLPLTNQVADTAETNPCRI